MSAAPFLLASLALLLTPGPTNTLLAASGAAMGARKALALPLAEAIGYLLAISLFLVAADILHDAPAALPAMKAVASVWLLVSAIGLWSRPVVPDQPARKGAFLRVLFTTVLNPKAMLVGTIMVPSLMPDQAWRAVASFVLLSVLAGVAWTVFGALLPQGMRRYSYKAAAMAVAGFGFAAAISAVHAG